MLDRLEHQFTLKLSENADLREQFGETCLGFARAAFGHHEISTAESPQLACQNKKVSASVATIFAFFLTLPISGLLTIFGAAFLASSETHREKYDAFLRQNHVANPS